MANAQLADLTLLISSLRRTAKLYEVAGDRRDPSVIMEELVAEISVPNLDPAIGKLRLIRPWPKRRTAAT